jgi:hypothetical protein
MLYLQIDYAWVLVQSIPKPPIHPATDADKTDCFYWTMRINPECPLLSRLKFTEVLREIDCEMAGGYGADAWI